MMMILTWWKFDIKNLAKDIVHKRNTASTLFLPIQNHQKITWKTFPTDFLNFNYLMFLKIFSKILKTFCKENANKEGFLKHEKIINQVMKKVCLFFCFWKILKLTPRWKFLPSFWRKLLEVRGELSKIFFLFGFFGISVTHFVEFSA